MENKSVSVVDMLGNYLHIGDPILVLIPHTYTSFRKAVVRDLKMDGYSRQSVYVEYDDGRLYSNVEYFNIKEHSLKFNSKPTRVWRSNYDVIKFDSKYFD